MKLYLRRTRLTLGQSGGSTIENLRTIFDVEATISGTPNVGIVEVVNLNKASRGKVGREWDWLRLEAGYRGSPGAEGNLGTILEGYIRDHEHIRAKTDVITHIECGDGDTGYREGVISETVDDGDVKTAVDKMLAEMPDVARGDMPGLEGVPPSKRPLVLYGSIASELDKLGRAHGFYWSIQNGALEIIPEGGAIDQEVVISPQTGMIGVPTLTDNGIKVQALLNPHVRPNRIIRVVSDTLDMNVGSGSGRYRVDRVQFKGDNGKGVNPDNFAMFIEGTTLS